MGVWLMLRAAGFKAHKCVVTSAMSNRLGRLQPQDNLHCSAAHFIKPTHAYSMC